MIWVSAEEPGLSVTVDGITDLFRMNIRWEKAAVLFAVPAKPPTEASHR